MDLIQYLKALSGDEAAHECKRHLNQAIDQLHYAAIAADRADYGTVWKLTLQETIDAAQHALDQLQ